VRIVERLPLRAIVLGRRRPSGPTVFEAALEGARTAAEIPLLDEPPVVRAALLLAIGQEEVLRVAIGPASHQLHDQRTALEALRAAKPPRAVAKRVPWPVAHGQAGLGNWSLEKRVAGTGTSTAPTGQLLADCVEFLVALHRAAAGGGGGQSLARDAETVANACKSRASEVRWLAKQVERELTEVQRGFGHGDFWGGNLLRDGARLTGVVDWTTAGPNRLPLMDLLHLHVSSKRWLTNGHLGPVLTNETLPWAREGGRSDDVRDYCRRIDLELTSKQVEALVVAYWLDRIGYELRTFTDRTRPSWVEQNVDAVLDTVLSGGYGFDS
jgi:aminoglycoside phosphotransferase (APT) family kinase protein